MLAQSVWRMGQRQPVLVVNAIAGVSSSTCTSTIINVDIASAISKH